MDSTYIDKTWSMGELTVLTAGQCGIALATFKSARVAFPEWISYREVSALLLEISW